MVVPSELPPVDLPLSHSEHVLQLQLTNLGRAGGEDRFVLSILACDTCPLYIV